MGKFIFGYGIDALLDDIVAYSRCTASTEDSTYELDNAHDLDHLRRHFRFTVATTSTLVYNFGAAQTLAAVMLNDVNFTDVTLYRSSNGSDWTKIGDYTIAMDVRTRRYKVYIPLTAFNYQYLKIEVPTQTPTDLTVFRIGTVLLIPTIIALSRNISYGYQYRLIQPAPKVVTYPTGSAEKVSMGALVKYIGSMQVDPLERAYGSEWYQINAFDPTEHLVLYENFDDTSACYLVQRSENISVTWRHKDIIAIERVEFEEVI